jgi:hypothetical protein
MESVTRILVVVFKTVRDFFRLFPPISETRYSCNQGKVLISKLRFAYVVQFFVSVHCLRGDVIYK